MVDKAPPAADRDRRPCDILDVTRAGRPELWDLWERCQPLSADDYCTLRPYGITPEVVIQVGGIGKLRISTAGRIWMPAAKGRSTMTLPVFRDPPRPAWIPDEVLLTDLLAVHPSGRFWSYLGGDGLVLGEGRYLRALRSDGTLQLFYNPLAWARAGGAGACFIDDAFIEATISQECLAA